MANLPKDFIGLDNLQHVAEEVSKEIVMGPASMRAVRSFT